MLLVLVRAKIHIRPYPPKRKRGNGTFSYLCLPTEPSDDTHHGTSSFPTDTRVHPPAPHGRCAHTRPPGTARGGRGPDGSLAADSRLAGGTAQAAPLEHDRRGALPASSSAGTMLLGADCRLQGGGAGRGREPDGPDGRLRRRLLLPGPGLHPRHVRGTATGAVRAGTAQPAPAGLPAREGARGGGGSVPRRDGACRRPLPRPGTARCQRGPHGGHHRLHARRRRPARPPAAQGATGAGEALAHARHHTGGTAPAGCAAGARGVGAQRVPGAAVPADGRTDRRTGARCSTA